MLEPTQEDPIMADPPPDVWAQLFDELPVIIRGILGVFTFGIFTLAGMLWRWSRQDVKRVEERLEATEKRIERRLERIERLLWDAHGYSRGQGSGGDRDEC